MWLNEGRQGADFIAYHIDGNTSIKVQLTGRLTMNRMYNNRDIYITFNQDGRWYLYPHDQLQDELLDLRRMQGTRSWDVEGAYSYPYIPQNLVGHMAQYRLL
ncbi:hypothetical protein NKDENANG_03611 [Candidatus Entotheonellaceae bacterium PAL068K]